MEPTSNIDNSDESKVLGNADAPFGEILKDYIGYDRLVKKKSADGFQDLCMGMVHDCGVQGHLFLDLLVHFILSLTSY